jgi:hypothetical protein
MAPPEPGTPTHLQPAALFDEEAVRVRPSLTGYAEPARAQATLRRVLDAVHRRVVDEVGRQAVEAARLALGVLDAISVQHPPPSEASQRASFGGGFRSILGLEEPPVAPPVSPAPRTVVDVDRLFAWARDALDSAERMRMDAKQPEPAVATRPWAEDPQLLALFQDLFAGARRQQPEFLHTCIEHLGEDLALEHGIDVVEFDGTNHLLFEVVPAAVAAPRTLRPALVHKGELLRPGEATEPSAGCSP